MSFSVSVGPGACKGLLLRARAGDAARDVALAVEPGFLLDHEDGESECRLPLLLLSTG